MVAYPTQGRLDGPLPVRVVPVTPSRAIRLKVHFVARYALLMPFGEMRALISGGNADVDVGLGRSGATFGCRPVGAMVALACDLASVFGVSPITLILESLEAVLAFAMEIAVRSAIEVRLRRRLLVAAYPANHGAADNPAQVGLLLVWEGGHGAAPRWAAAAKSLPLSPRFAEALIYVNDY
jgi:hypothetical protein